jgi:hypothetical protein
MLENNLKSPITTTISGRAANWKVLRIYNVDLFHIHNLDSLKNMYACFEAILFRNGSFRC